MKEKLANFFSYITFFGFVIGVSLAGYYVWTHRAIKSATPAPTRADEIPALLNSDVFSLTGRKPSELLTAVMAENLPPLWQELGQEEVALSPTFQVTEEAIIREKGKSGKLQPAWNIAGQLCDQIRAVLSERNTAARAIFSEEPAVQKPSAARRSKIEEKELAAKAEFFQGSAKRRWLASVTGHQKKIEVLYRQLLSAEAQAAF